MRVKVWERSRRRQFTASASNSSRSPRKVLDAVANYLVAARDNLLSGNALIGVESGERDDNPLTFALPGNAKEVYFEIKRPVADQRLAPLPELWEMD